MACTVFLLRVAVGPLEKFGIVSTGGIKSCCAIDASGVDAESVGSGIFGSTFSYDKKIPQQIISGRRIFCVIPSNSRFCPIFRDGIFPRCMSIWSPALLRSFLLRVSDPPKLPFHILQRVITCRKPLFGNPRYD